MRRECRERRSSWGDEAPASVASLTDRRYSLCRVTRTPLLIQQPGFSHDRPPTITDTKRPETPNQHHTRGWKLISQVIRDSAETHPHAGLVLHITRDCNLFVPESWAGGLANARDGCGIRATCGSNTPTKASVMTRLFPQATESHGEAAPTRY